MKVLEDSSVAVRVEEVLQSRGVDGFCSDIVSLR
jgi:hypothetical protein